MAFIYKMIELDQYYGDSYWWIRWNPSHPIVLSQNRLVQWPHLNIANMKEISYFALKNIFRVV